MESFIIVSKICQLLHYAALLVVCFMIDHTLHIYTSHAYNIRQNNNTKLQNNAKI